MSTVTRFRHSHSRMMAVLGEGVMSSARTHSLGLQEGPSRQVRPPVANPVVPAMQALCHCASFVASACTASLSDLLLASQLLQLLGLLLLCLILLACCKVSSQEAHAVLYMHSILSVMKGAV